MPTRTPSGQTADHPVVSLNRAGWHAFLITRVGGILRHADEVPRETRVASAFGVRPILYKFVGKVLVFASEFEKPFGRRPVADWCPSELPQLSGASLPKPGLFDHRAKAFHTTPP